MQSDRSWMRTAVLCDLCRDLSSEGNSRATREDLPGICCTECRTFKRRRDVRAGSSVFAARGGKYGYRNNKALLLSCVDDSHDRGRQIPDTRRFFYIILYNKSDSELPAHYSRMSMAYRSGRDGKEMETTSNEVTERPQPDHPRPHPRCDVTLCCMKEPIETPWDEIRVFHCSILTTCSFSSGHLQHRQVSSAPSDVLFPADVTVLTLSLHSLP